MVSPWMKNGDLTSFMEKNPDLSDLDRRKIVSYSLCQDSETDVTFISQCIGIAKGLLYLHTHETQIIHGDLKGVCGHHSLKFASPAYIEIVEYSV